MTEPIHVLHVDDDPAFAELTATFLERADDRFVVDSVTSVEAGLDRLAATDVDCVVSDYEMDRLTGIEFLDAIRTGYGDLPFVLFTGKGSEEIASEAISAGVTDYLQKGRGTDRYTILAHRISNAVSAHRSRAESESRRQRLEGILTAVPGCVVQVDADGQFVFANERAKAVLGLTRATLTDCAYNDIEWGIRDLDGDPIPDAELPFRRVYETGEPLYGYRHTIRWPDGTEKVLLVNGAPTFDDDGAVESVLFSLVDVTDRRAQERRLEVTTHRLDLALEATDTGVWEWDLETDAVVWDETLERVMGLEPGTFEGTYEAFAARIHRADLDDVERRLERALETDGDYRIECRMRRADGTVLWTESHATVVDNEKGRRMVGIHHDITDRKRREAEVERTNRRLDSILESTTTPMFLKDADGRYLLVNDHYRRLFGLSDSEVIGRTDAEIHPTTMAAEVGANDRRVLDAAEPLRTTERIVVDGEKRTFLTSKVPVHDGTDDGPPNAVFGVAKDITEREAYRTTLERQNELLEQFAGVVSHDLRSPITVAQGRLELASEECDSVHLDDAADALARSQELIGDLLALSRQGRGTDEIESVSLADAVDACWRTVETGTATLAVETTGTIRADRSRLGQLLQNLVRNAVEHGSPGDRTDDSSVSITVGDLNDGFYVADDGPGIPPDVRERAFETASEGTPGFGLGIVAQVAAAHGWTVRIAESEGGGARFEISGVESA
ncbi:PAS domain S-box protein [Haloplanus natans]|uniref:PAS domain S-box protein n=1 Tax=Haloplanus natans TaxID=376171 RepID=UPI0006777373|nr:PAS domain S-box protein [Haloplanus natans]